MILELPQEAKDKVIWWLCDLVARNHQLTVRELYAAVMDRERLGSTALEQGVALPHGRSSQLSRIILAFGRSRPGLVLDGQERLKINLVFLLLVPEHSTGEHLAVLSTLGRLLSQAAIRESLLAADSPERILEIFESAA